MTENGIIVMFLIGVFIVSVFIGRRMGRLHIKLNLPPPK